MVDGYTRPEFGQELRIIDGIHPLLERNVQQTKPIPNNVVSFVPFLPLEKLFRVSSTACDARLQRVHRDWSEHGRQNDIHQNDRHPSNYGSVGMLRSCKVRPIPCVRSYLLANGLQRFDRTERV